MRKPARRLLALREKSERGFSVIEVIVAMSITALLMTSLTRAMGSAVSVLHLSRSTAAASSVARGALENTQGLGWASIGHVPGSLASDPAVSGGYFDPDGSGPLPAEPTVENGMGG